MYSITNWAYPTMFFRKTCRLVAQVLDEGAHFGRVRREEHLAELNQVADVLRREPTWTGEHRWPNLETICVGQLKPLTLQHSKRNW